MIPAAGIKLQPHNKQNPSIRFRAGKSKSFLSLSHHFSHSATSRSQILFLQLNVNSLLFLCLQPQQHTTYSQNAPAVTRPMSRGKITPNLGPPQTHRSVRLLFSWELPFSSISLFIGLPFPFPLSRLAFHTSFPFTNRSLPSSFVSSETISPPAPPHLHLTSQGWSLPTTSASTASWLQTLLGVSSSGFISLN